jgi:hypothetical protein
VSGPRDDYAAAYVEYLDDTAEADLEDQLSAALKLTDTTDKLLAKGLTQADIYSVHAEFSELN